MSIETWNYYRDRRTCDRAEAPVLHTVDEEGYEVEQVLPTQYEVCPVCEGKGSHVNPAIDCCGLGREDFEDDDDFAEDYRNGRYDIPCNRCGGLRVVLVPDYKQMDAETIKEWERQCRNDAQYEAMCRAERAMGA